MWVPGVSEWEGLGIGDSFPSRPFTILLCEAGLAGSTTDSVSIRTDGTFIHIGIC